MDVFEEEMSKFQNQPLSEGSFIKECQPGLPPALERRQVISPASMRILRYIAEAI